MSDEIKERLEETSQACLKSYDGWRKDQKNADARGTLQEAVHELRKVASRLEIEMAISERDQKTQKPIPIPQHRDTNKRGQKNNESQSAQKAAAENKASEDKTAAIKASLKKRSPKKDAGEDAA